MPLTKQEFIKQVKTKYPSYETVDDEKLFNAMIKKYPVYKKQIKD